MRTMGCAVCVFLLSSSSSAQGHRSRPPGCSGRAPSAPRPCGTPPGRTRSPEDPGPAPSEDLSWPSPGATACRPDLVPQFKGGCREETPAGCRSRRPTLTAALHPASWTWTPALHSRPPPPPPPLRAGARRPHPPSARGLPAEPPPR